MTNAEFRVWELRRKLMFTKMSYVTPKGGLGEEVDGKSYQTALVGECVHMLYLDAFDKYGVKICEDDVIMDKDGKYWQVMMRGFEWIPFSSRFDIYPEDCEVVGNIHQNPELGMKI